MRTINRPHIKPFSVYQEHQIPFLSIVGFSGSGKTTLMERLISELSGRGLRIGSIKHDAHGFEMDHPGKDSYRHKQAGAAVSMIASPSQVGMVRDVDRDHRLEELVAMLPKVDMALAEGFKRGTHPKIEIHRPEANPQPACKGDPHLIAVVSDAVLHWGVLRFGIDDVCALANFVLQYFQMEEQSEPTCAGMSL